MKRHVEVASAQATGYCSPGMASVMGGDGKCWALQSCEPAINLYPLNLGKIPGVLISHQAERWNLCACGFDTSSTEAWVIQAFGEIKCLFSSVNGREIKPRERSEEE